jgi:hypothetical protein
MKTLYKFFKTAEVSQQITIHQKVKVEKYNLKSEINFIKYLNIFLIFNCKTYTNFKKVFQYVIKKKI